MSKLSFVLEKSSGSDSASARATHFTTLHGEVKTPIFMPVGTQATVKSQTLETLQGAGSNVLLANTYHLMLRPGKAVFEKFGGIHRFMQWNKPILTDSGGFQLFSLPGSRVLNEAGAIFKSYVDGKDCLLSPETSIAMQGAINSDIMMVLDQCIPSTADKKTASEAADLTTRWAKRSLLARGDSPQALFGIIQGACWPELRKKSANEICSLPFDGFAIGGLAVGETREERYDFAGLSASLLPTNAPRYLMGVGTPLDILEAVHRGVDMFDCILPLEQAQRGTAFTSRGRVQIRRSVHKFSEQALDPSCSCPTCKCYSRAYLHHLHKANEGLAWTLLGQHNLWFYHRLMEAMRQAILDDTWQAFYQTKRNELDLDDLDNPVESIQRLPKDARVKRLGDYELHKSKHGPWYCVVQRSSGETMHSVNDPALEARELYVEQTKICTRIQTKDICIWDVGLGAATNAMSLIHAVENLEPSLRKKLTLESFERDLDPLRLSIRHAKRLPLLHHTAPAILLEKGYWVSEDEKIEWKLNFGDFAEMYTQASTRPDIILYDPFSPKVDAPLWSFDFFTKLARHLRTLEPNRQVALYTYSASTAVRSALLAATWYVARGLPSGPKNETTLAFLLDPRPAKVYSIDILDETWLIRRRKSHARYPATLSPADESEWDRRIEEHPQFRSQNDNHGS